MINWNPIKDRHIEAMTPLGKMFIRVNKEGKVTSMYTMFGSTEKIVPDEEILEEVIGAQLKLEEVYYGVKKYREQFKKT